MLLLIPHRPQLDRLPRQELQEPPARRDQEMEVVDPKRRRFIRLDTEQQHAERVLQSGHEQHLQNEGLRRRTSWSGGVSGR